MPIPITFLNITNESNAIHITNLERIEVPPGTFGQVPGASPIPRRDHLSHTRKSGLPGRAGPCWPATDYFQLIKIHDANKIAEADLKTSEASERKAITEVVFKVQQLSLSVGCSLRSSRERQPNCKSPPERRAEPRRGAGAEQERGARPVCGAGREPRQLA